MARETIQCLQPREFGKVEAQIVGKLHGVNTAQKKRCGPVPPSSEKSPEIAETGAHPAVKAPFNRHGGSQLGGDQRNRDAPEKWDHEQVDQRHSRARSGDHVFEPEGAAGAVGEHYPDEIEQTGFAQGRLGWVGHGVGLYGEGRDWRFQIADCQIADCRSESVDRSDFSSAECSSGSSDRLSSI